MATASSSDFYLAEELIFQILSWLPGLSLFRFKSVCKSWFSIISSPTFIETHLINSKKKQPSSLIRLSKDKTKYSYFIYDGVNIYSFLDDLVRINFPQDFNFPQDYIRRIRCFHSCNGLVYIHVMYVHRYRFDFRDVSIICNPLTRRLKELPFPEKTSVTDRVFTGFGFDYISSDYKILRVGVVDGYGTIEAELYSVSADSWKEIQIPNAMRSSLPRLGSSNFIHVNGVLYAAGCKTILAFYLHSEEFKVIPYPKPMQYSKRSWVFDYGGSTAMFFKEHMDYGEVNDDRSNISLWTFNDVSWTKKFNFVDHYLKTNRVHLYLGAGQFVARDYNSGYIIYDHRKKETIPLSRDSSSLALYTESLVSLKGFKVW